MPAYEPQGAGRQSCVCAASLRGSEDAVDCQLFVAAARRAKQNASSRNQLVPPHGHQTPRPPAQQYRIRCHQTMALGDDIRQCLIVPVRKPPLNPECPPTCTSSSISTQHHDPDHRPDQQRLPAQPQHEHGYPDSMKMELDASTMPGQILSIDDFMAQRKSNRHTTVPAAELVPEPRAISARSSKHVIELHEKHQAFGVPRPDFVFEGGSMQGWKARTIYLGKELSVADPCGSKQEAKEKLSEMCLSIFDELEAAGQLTKAPKTKKQKTDHAQPAPVHVEKEPTANYIGQLLGTRLLRYTPRTLLMLNRVPKKHGQPATHIY